MKDTIIISNEDWVKAMKVAQEDKEERVLDNLKFDKDGNKDGGDFSSGESRQPENLRNKTIKDLRKEAKELGISAGGRKLVIYNRIQEHAKEQSIAKTELHTKQKQEIKDSTITSLDKKISITTRQLNTLQGKVDEIYKEYSKASERRDIKQHELDKLKITAQNLKDIL